MYYDIYYTIHTLLYGLCMIHNYTYALLFMNDTYHIHGIYCVVIFSLFGKSTYTQPHIY